MSTAKTTKKQRKPGFQPGQSGNPRGRPDGSRNRVTIAVETLLDGEGEALTRKVVELAKDGDMMALRLCLDRICPPRKERPVRIRLPKVETPNDTVDAIATILEAVSAGDITPGEAQQLAALVEGQRRVLETNELEARITALEKGQSK
jgi:hypothetical protein